MGYNITKENASENGRKGGIKSAEVRRTKKNMKEALNVLLSMPLSNGKTYDVDDVKNFASLKGKNITVEQALLITQIQKALKGDLGAMEFIRDTSGQKPKDEMQVTTIELPKFVDEDKLE